jgi:hypothetical protein
MHQLTIATDTATSTTGHDDFADAHRALMSHVIAADLYLHASWPAPCTAATFKLLRLDQADSQPRITGTATIEPAPAKPVIGPYYSAEAALRWTTDHTATWRHGCDADPGVRYPLAVLTAARAEARYLFTAGTIYHEAASLSDVGTTDVPRPRQTTLEILRGSAINAGRHASITNAAELAAAVQAQLTADITPQQTAALIWYYALILWGVTAS